MRKKTNKETISQFIILVATAILLLYGMISGKITLFVHPRFRIVLWISIFVLILFAFSVLSDRKKGRHNINLQQYIIYVIPLLLALVFPPISTGRADIVLADSIAPANSAENYNQSDNEDSTIQDINQSNENTQSEEQEGSGYLQEWDDSQTTSDNSEYSDVDEYLNATQETQDSVDEKKESDASLAYNTNKVNGSYVIGDDVYADWIMDIYDHPDDFIGKKYQYVAQVFSMDGLEDSQFLAGRYFMVCCAADLVGYGVICDSDIRSKLKEDQWINITGTISKYEYGGTEVPIMKDAVITDAVAPKDEYIYYNNY
ncbi:MAG: TIGR03943 family protein [Anaerocolumna sp.]